jgi:ribosome-binding factor A
MSNRLAKINSLIQKKVSQILREIELPLDTLVTVTRADTSVDLRYVTVYLSVLPKHHGPSTLQRLEKRRPLLQALLSKQLPMRPRPSLRLALDAGESHAARIEEILAKEKLYGPRTHKPKPPQQPAP